MKVIAKPHVNAGKAGESRHPHISPNRPYVVVGFDDECFRILNDIDQPVLYPKDLFEMSDPQFPDDWVRRDYGDGEYHVDPPSLASPGFYEDYFDGEPKAVQAFNEYVARLKQAP